MFDSIIQALKKFGILESKIRNDIIQVVSDGASTFVDRKSGVGVKFIELNPKTINWHCLCHRLELSIADAKS